MKAFLETEDGTRHAVENGMIVGRDSRVAIVIKDKKASRRHAQIEVSPGSYLLSDTGSSNGTHVNGKRVKTHLLAVGDRIRLGDTILQLLGS